MIRPVRRPERGASAVEFALVMVPLFYLTFGIIQYGLYFWGMQAGTSATSDAVRRITVGDCETETQLRPFLKTRIGSASPTAEGAIEADPVYKTESGGTTASPSLGGSVILTVKFDALNLNFPFIPLPDNGLVTREVFGRIESVDPAAGCS